MELEFDLNRSVEQNAGHYFDLSKKAKKKLQGAKTALQSSRKELAELQLKGEKFIQQELPELEQS